MNVQKGFAASVPCSWVVIVGLNPWKLALLKAKFSMPLVRVRPLMASPSSLVWSKTRMTAS